MSMLKPLLARLKPFGREDGSATIEFVILFPFFITIFLSAVELGMYTMRQAMLERGLDLAVRDVRLGTGVDFDHDALKDQICEYAGFIPDCDNGLRLEMIQIDLRTNVTIPATPDCSDQSEPVSPVRTFISGQANELMVLRACVKFDPLFPTTGLGKQLDVDGAGQAAMIATAAFVQEPN